MVLILPGGTLTGSDRRRVNWPRSSTHPIPLRPSPRMVMPEAADDYDILQFELDEVYDNPQAEGADE